MDVVRRPQDAVEAEGRSEPIASALAFAAISLLAVLLSSGARAMPAPGDADPVDATVTSNTGAATYRIPIEVPPGPGGLAPQLALSYSSHAGDGIAGIGWRLHLGEIRCTTRQRGAPDFAAPNFVCPRYELDGQLLTYNSAQGRYHTFIESFREIKYLSETSGWVANSPDGTILRYGSSPDSRIAAPGGVTARWLLSEIEDRFQNKILITYSSAPETTPTLANVDVGMVYPADITYASDERTIHFLYEPRPDPLADYAGGIERTVTRRLKEIQVKSDGQLVHKRTFGYAGLAGVSYTTARSRLAWAQLVGSDGTSTLPRQEFRYTDHGLTGNQWGGDVPAWHLGNLPNLPTYDAQLADVDGDGLLDKVRGPYWRGWQPGSVELNNGDGWDPPDSYWSAKLTATCCPSILLRATLAIPDAVIIPQPGQQPPWRVDSPSLGVVQGTVTMELNIPPNVQLDDLTEDTIFHPGIWVSWGSFQRIVDAGDPNATPRGELLVSEGVAARLRVVDLNADGLADLVYSFSLSGISENLTPAGAALETPQSVPGTHVLQGYRNTGSEWVRDDELVSGVPPFSAVMVENPEEVNKGYAVDDLPYHWRHFSCKGNHELLGFGQSWYEAAYGSYGWMDFCLNFLHFGPRFVDLNGDGYLDLIQSEQRPYTGTSSNVAWRMIADGSPSRAWIQNPQHAPGSPRWVRAPAFDPPFFHQRMEQVYGNCDAEVFFERCPASRSYDAGVRIVDLNRDGLADVVWNDPNPPPGSCTPTVGSPPIAKSASAATCQQTGVLINRGTGTAADGSAWCSSHGECAWAAAYVPPYSFTQLFQGQYVSVGDLADVNGDGWIDAVTLYARAARLHSRDGVDTPVGQSPSLWQTVSGFDAPDAAGFETTTLADVNGDGAADLLISPPRDILSGFQGDEETFISGATPSPTQATNAPDLLREVRNGRGGTISFDYERATTQRDAALEGVAADDATYQPYGESSHPGPGGLWHLPVVSAVTIEGPNRTPGTTSYAYAHPRFSPEFRSSFGFRLMERTRPDGSKVQELYYQIHGRAGRPSQLSVVGAGDVLFFRQRQDWKVPTQNIPGSLVHPEVFVGRLAKVETVRGSFVGAPGFFPGTLLGPKHEQTLTYDDDLYGFNFVKQIDDVRPTGTVRTVRVPVSPAGAGEWLRGFVAEERQEDASGLVLSRAAFTYTSRGRVEFRTDDVEHRGDSPATVTTSFLYDGYGNLIRLTGPPTPANPSGRVTEFCYDGDTATCETVNPAGQDTHSVLVGIKDPLANSTTLTPDPKTGLIVAVASSYTDEPGISRELDPFGRVKKEYATPFGGSEFPRTEYVYGDSAEPPYVERKEFVSRAEGSAFVKTLTVDDGFGGVWKTIHEKPGGYVGTAVWHDPGNARVRETYPVDCSTDALCPNLTGETEIVATVTQSDILGRPYQITTPDGTTTLTYGVLTREAPDSGQQMLLEWVLTQNAKGDLTGRLLDGDRLVWVDECSDTQPACPTADRTYYAYEPSGELEAVYDAKVGAEQATANDPAHKLAYHYDAVGRVWKIEDPDGGTSTTVYDALGNVIETQNARQQGTSDKTIFTYDSLDRLRTINQPPTQPLDHGLNYETTYRDNERRPWKEFGRTQTGGDEYRRTFTYDDMGRVFRKELWTWGTSLLLDFTYDELGRTSAITYPDDETVVRYEYAGAYLERVCEVASAASPCPSPGTQGAVFYVTDVGYDPLGRRQTISTPAGSRTFTYLPETHRLAKDTFTSAGGAGLYERTLNYESTDPNGKGNYDALGNLLKVTSTTVGSSATGVDFGATYTYDARNRLRSWRPGSAAEPPDPPAYFHYDALGNLAWKEVASDQPTAGQKNQVFGGPRPHAITERSDLGIEYDYDADGNLKSEVWPTSQRYYTFDSLNRLTCVGPSAGSCITLATGYDAGGSRVYDEASGASQITRAYADELFTLILESDRADFHIFAFGEEIAYKRKAPVTLRTAGTWALPWGEFEAPPPFAVALLAALGLASLGLLAIRLDWAPGLREEPTLSALALGLVAVLALPPLPARAGGGGTVEYRRWILSDPLGSATVILDANPEEPGSQEGRAERETVYAPFGKIHDDAGAAGTDTEVFAGHPREPATNLHYMRARWQNPTTGSFLSVDPLVGAVSDPQSYNGYSYARSNPLTHIDPTGMTCSTAAAASCSMYVAETGHTYTVTIWNLSIDLDLSASIDAGFSQMMSGMNFGSSSGFGGFGIGGMFSPGSFGPGGMGPSFSFPGGGGPGITPGGFSSFLNGAQVALDATSIGLDATGIGGFVSWIPDLANAGISLGRGDYTGVGLSMLAAVPFIGVAANAARLTRAAKFGIQPYTALRKVLRGTGLQAHHLIERRFANVMGDAGHTLSVALTKAEHQAFTNAWRRVIGYGQGTANATREQVQNAARQIYRDYPEILGALGL